MLRAGYETRARFFRDVDTSVPIWWYPVPKDRPCLPVASFVQDSDWQNEDGPRTPLFKGRISPDQGEGWFGRPFRGRRLPPNALPFTGHYCGTAAQWLGDLVSTRPADIGNKFCCFPGAAPAAGAFAGEAVFAAVGTGRIPAVGAFAGEANLLGFITGAVPAVGTWPTDSTLSGIGTWLASGAGSFSGDGSWSVVGSSDTSGVGSLTASASFLALGGTGLGATAAFSANSELGGIMSSTASASGSWTGDATLSAVGDSSTSWVGTWTADASFLAVAPTSSPGGSTCAGATLVSLATLYADSAPGGLASTWHKWTGLGALTYTYNITGSGLNPTWTFFSNTCGSPTTLAIGSGTGSGSFSNPTGGNVFLQVGGFSATAYLFKLT